MALEILQDLSVGLVVDRIPLALSVALVLEILRDLSVGLVVDRIPLALSVALADATASGCCASRYSERAVSHCSAKQAQQSKAQQPDGRVGEVKMNQDTIVAKRSWTSPRAAAIAGIVFSLLLITSLVLIRISVPAKPQEAGEWLAGNWGTVSLALNLLPFAGIAFLWFIGVVRDRLGQQEDQLFATVFLGSGLLFLAMLFTSAAIAGGIIQLYGTAPGMLIDSGMYAFGRIVTYEIMNIYTMKMAGVFMLSTSTLSLRTKIVPRWMAFLGIGLALFLLLSLGFFYWAPLVFPLWVLLISVYILQANYERPKGELNGSQEQPMNEIEK